MSINGPSPARNATWLECCFHIITTIIGSGILYLPFFFAVLGWIGGAVSAVAFALITWFTSHLLAGGAVIDGVRHRTYQSAVESALGRRAGIVLAVVQYTSLFLSTVGINITASNCAMGFARSFKSFSNTALCSTVDANGYCSDVKFWCFTLAFAAVQMLVSMLPTLDASALSSAIGMVLAIGYSGTTIGVSAWSLATRGPAPTTPMPYPDIDGAQLTWNMFNALGGIAFAFSFSFVLIEVSDTVREPSLDDPRPKSVVSQTRLAVMVSIATVTVLYVTVAVLGYLAYGYEALYNQSLIVTFWSLATSSLATTGTTIVARATYVMILVHMFSAYQILAQPIFAAVARRAGFVSRMSDLLFRFAYVGIVAFIAAALPFFSDIVGLIGAIGFWPATVFFPIEIYRITQRPSRIRVILVETLSAVCLVVSVCAVIGSLQLIVRDAGTYSFFDTD